jgi:CheY-like chemotaxis protein
VDLSNQQVVVTVLDTGIGMTPEVLALVFEIFTQADQTLDRKRGGLGLGLPLVKGLVELHGGHVQAASQGLGQGSEFTFRLPLGSRPRVASPRTADATPARRSLRILIVEDNLDAARSLQTLLLRAGHEVRVAYTGMAGMRAATEWKPEVVLCDLGLPELDGFELARQLRSQPNGEKLHLIAVSGYGQDEDIHRSKESSFDLHLTKPVNPVELQRLLAVLKIGR